MKYLILVLFFSVNAYSHDSKEKHSEVTLKDIYNLDEKETDELITQAKLELYKDNIAALYWISPLDFYPHLDQETDWSRLTYTRSNVYLALRILDMAFKKGACFTVALAQITKRSHKAYHLDLNANSINNYVKDPHKFKSLKNFIPYYYASLYVSLKLRTYKEKKSYYSKKLDKKINSDFWVLDMKQKIEKKLNQTDLKKVWSIIHEWEKRENYKIYNPKDDEECHLIYGKDDKELNQQVIKIYLEK